MRVGCPREDHGDRGSVRHRVSTPSVAPTSSALSSPGAAASSGATASSEAATSDAGDAAVPTVGPASSRFITNVCSAITITDAQATVQPAIDAIGFDPDNQDPAGIFICTIDAADQAVTVTVEPEDVAMANYESDVAAENVPAVPALPGVGDVAVCTQVANNPPDVYAHKGHVTCEVKTSGHTGTQPDLRPERRRWGSYRVQARPPTRSSSARCARDVFAAIG